MQNVNFWSRVVTTMLVTLLTVFAVCWTPLQAAMLYVVSHHENDKAVSTQFNLFVT